MSTPAATLHAVKGSTADPVYASGLYFENPNRHGADAAFKAGRFLSLLTSALPNAGRYVASYADVGCGSGDAVRSVAQGLRERGYQLQSVKGYDVSPHVARLAVDGNVQFANVDFAAAGEFTDLVTLFDVVEHVPDPIEFIRSVASRCSILGLHVPLDNSLNAAWRDLFRAKVADPGHLMFLDSAAALNLLAFAGLRVVDYTYTLGFQAPSGRATAAARLVNPLRALIAKASPWLLSKTLGGVSLMVIALTPSGMQRLSPQGTSR